MKKFLATITLCCMAIFSSVAATPILGTTEATVDRMYEFVKSQNSSFDREIAEQFYAVGKVYGIRGDIAICQSIIETGWFKFNDGTAVTPDQHNYCGLGVTELGEKGESFSTIKDGVTAQIQHLYAYACTKNLPDGEVLIDNRFKYVDRGEAPNWEDLSGKWSMASDYGTKIIEKFNEMMAFSMPEPAITATPASISLSGVKGGAETSQTITIKGVNLSSAMSYNSSTSAVKISVSNWSNLTGGTMTITLDTSKDAGTYNGYIAVQSGAGDNIVRLEIPCTATITEPVALPSLSFTEGWNLSETAGLSANNEWIKSVRNFDYANGNLYCVYNNNEIRVVEARCGIYHKNLQVPTSVVTSATGTYTLCDVKCFDDCIITCNLVHTLGESGGELRFYLWQNEDATPTLLFSTNVSERAGDCFGAAGSIDGTLRLVTGNKNGVITEYTRTNGTWTTKTINTGLSTSSSTRVIPVDGGYYVDGKGILPTMIDESGATLYTLSSAETCAWGNGFDTFSYDGKNYLMTASYLNNSTEANKSNYTGGIMRLYDVTNGWANGTAIGSYPENGLGTTQNTNCAGGVVTNAGSDYAEAWVLAWGQGLAYYKSGNAPEANTAVGISDITQESKAEIVVTGNTISIQGDNATGLSIISLTGAVVAQSKGNSVNTESVEKGIYIAVATLKNGTRISSKIAIK